MKQLSTLFVLILTFPIFAATVSDLESIRRRTEASGSEVSASDRSQIEEFWETTLNTMLLADSARDIVEIRRRLESLTGSEPLSFYSSAYIAAARQHLTTALDNTTRIGDPQRQQLIRQNLMVLTAQLKSPELADIALAHLDDKNPVVRYWAVKAVTNSGVIGQLSSEVTADEDAKTKILEALANRLAFEQQTEIQSMIINFAAAMNHPTARQILLTLADQRIEAYTNWSIGDGKTDARLLSALGNTVLLNPDAEVKRTFARKFAELYALVFQAYMNGKDVLSEAELDEVINVILEVDRSVLARLLNVPQTGVLRALQRGVGLDREYETIFGDRLRAGDLGTLYKFDYGKDNAGNPITEPPSIGPLEDGQQDGQG